MATPARALTAEEATPSITDDDSGVPPTLAETNYAARARYFDSSNAFALKYPKVPSHQFVAERDRAVDPATGTALILLDLRKELGLDYPATTPLILTAYVRIKAGDKLATRFKASGELYYVMRGARSHDEWRRYDCVGAGRCLLPAGRRRKHTCRRRGRLPALGD